MKRAAVIVGAVLFLAACGGGGSSDEDQIKQVFTSFFSAKTPVSQKTAMLQDGARFRSTIASLANNPLAAQLSATVSSVTLQGSDKAKVVFSIYLGKLQVLKDQVDSAYKVNGKWVVGYAGLCKLLALQGSAPPACLPPEQQIKAAYQSFFTTSSLDARVAALENGPRFKSVIRSVLGAGSVPVTVSEVTLQGAAHARVVYSVKLAGMPLDNQTGYAVLQGGTWKVSDATLCSLVSIDGIGGPAICDA